MRFCDLSFYDGSQGELPLAWGAVYDMKGWMLGIVDRTGRPTT